MASFTIRSVLFSLRPPFLRRWLDRLLASPLGRRIAKGVFWSLAGALISRGLAMVSSVLVARMLGREGFGELGTIQATVGMFGVFAGFGLGMTATKFVAELKFTNPLRAGRIIGLSSLTSWASGGLLG